MDGWDGEGKEVAGGVLVLRVGRAGGLVLGSEESGAGDPKGGVGGVGMVAIVDA